MDYKKRFENIRLINASDNRYEKISSIGRGSFGQVFKAVHVSTKIPVAIKISVLSKKGLNAYKKKGVFSPEEYTFQLLTNVLLKKRRTQNFLFVFGLDIIDNCTISLSTRLYTGGCYSMTMELADFQLSEVSFDDEKLQQNIFFQLLTALYTLQDRFSILHNDIKAENILISKTSPGGTWDYKIESKSYYVENMGFVAIISDFGVSRSFDPAYTLDGYLGERNAYVKNGRFEPFTTDYFLSADKNGKYKKVDPYPFKWKTGSGTRNRFHKRYSHPDLKELPPFEFFYDIQDLIRTFIGGKRLSQPSHHKGLTLAKNFHKKLESYRIERNFYSTRWELDSVKFFLASYMIKDFSFSGRTGKILESFDDGKV